MRNSALIFLLSLAMLFASCRKQEQFFIASGYSESGKNDLVVCVLNADGSLRVISEVVAGDNPSFFTQGRDGLFYFANEVDSFNGQPGGGITVFRYDGKNHSLSRVASINQHAAGPCHVALSDDGKYLITANYGSGSVSVVKLDREGMPAEVTDVIYYGDRSHPHMTLFNPRLGVYYISDLGLDRIHQLKLDTAIGRLIDADVSYIKCEQGSGPRHMVTDESCSNLFVINELNSTISVYDILADTTKVKQTVSTLPDDFTGKSYCADIHLSGNGKRLYGSNRGHNSIVTFKVGMGGSLSGPSYQDCGGDWPRNFTHDPSGKYLLVANQRSNGISVLSSSAKASEGAETKLPFNAPACIGFIK